MSGTRKKTLISETVRQAKTIFRILSGSAAFSFFWKVIRKSFSETWKPADEKGYWTAALPMETRKRMASRIVLEGSIYAVIGGVLGLDAMVTAALHPSTLFFWIPLGVLAWVIGISVLLVDLWKRHILLSGDRVPFRSWLRKEFGRKDAGGK
ncbi:hypothetical protein AB4090_05450 [Acidithiobacillus sp. IBUN Pt1247-S3]|uniref:hypothetical protein n=1 Tax=Acidithiobacillus sp. IBUN Pt1247-S3 TaxID=3166642 RepID=UPI0034E5CC47